MAAHVSLNGLPYVKDFAPTKRADVVDAFEQHAVLQAVADSPGVILDTSGQLISGQLKL